MFRSCGGRFAELNQNLGKQFEILPQYSERKVRDSLEDSRTAPKALAGERGLYVEFEGSIPEGEKCLVVKTMLPATYDPARTVIQQGIKR